MLVTALPTFTPADPTPTVGVGALLAGDGLSVLAQNIVFPTIRLAGPDVNVVAADVPWTVSNVGVSVAGWRVVLSANDFTAGNGTTIPVSGFTVQLAAGDITTVSGGAPPTSQATAPLVLSPTGITILSADAGSGVGVYSFVLHFSLLVPGATSSGDYATTISVIIVAGP